MPIKPSKVIENLGEDVTRHKIGHFGSLLLANLLTSTEDVSSKN